MRKILTPCLFLFCLWIAAPQLMRAASPEENLIVPKKQQVGLIRAGMSAEEIGKLYGAKNLVMAKIPIAEGNFLEGAKLFAGTNRELELIWKDGDPKKIISDVNVIGSAWIFDNGLKIGMTLLQVEKINGKAFDMSGFDWDYGGSAGFTEGPLANVNIHFTYGDKQIDTSLVGDKTIVSSDPKLRAVNPTVEKPITVTMILP